MASPLTDFQALVSTTVLTSLPSDRELSFKNREDGTLEISEVVKFGSSKGKWESDLSNRVCLADLPFTIRTYVKPMIFSRRVTFVAVVTPWKSEEDLS